MRARSALYIANIKVVIREIQLKNKPKEFLNVSPTKTVPCLQIEDFVIDESLGIMKWALSINDPENWMQLPAESDQLIKYNDCQFKDSLDRVKYSIRFPNEDLIKHNEICYNFMITLDGFLKEGYLLSNRLTFLDMAILPFIRQFALIDKNWFDKQKWPNLIFWLNEFIESKLFFDIQKKYTWWSPETVEQIFP